MQITNKEEYKDIQISTLDLSTRTFNSLMRVGYNTLYLLIENVNDLHKFRNMGAKSISQIENLLLKIQTEGVPDTGNGVFSDNAETEDSTVTADAPGLPEEILNRPATDLQVSVRICNSFHLEGIKTIEQVLALNPTDILHMRNMGVLSQQQLLEQLDLLRELGGAYFEPAEDETEQPEEAPKYSTRELDIATVKKLQDGYGFKSIWLCEWYGLSRQRVYQKLSKQINRGQWCGKELLQEDRSTITEMINSESFFIEKEGAKYYLVNNMTDDCAFLVVSDADIKNK